MSSKNRYISDAPSAPAAIGPYSQVVVNGQLAFLSGQIPLDPSSGSLVDGGIVPQTEQVLKNCAAVLAHLGASFANVVKTTIFLTDLQNFQVVNGLYEKALQPSKPARSTVQVSALPKGAAVEIEMIAVLDR